MKFKEDLKTHIKKEMGLNEEISNLVFETLTKTLINPSEDFLKNITMDRIKKFEKLFRKLKKENLL